MKFTVIEGGLSKAAAFKQLASDAPYPTKAEVLAEGARRMRQIGFDEWRVREFASGRQMPTQVRYLQMQIEFIAEAIGRMDAIPTDFRDDRYWPPVA